MPLTLFFFNPFPYYLKAPHTTQCNITLCSLTVDCCVDCPLFSYFRGDMSKPDTHYHRDPICLTLAQVTQYVENGKKEFCCINQPLLNIPRDHIVLDEVHLLLRMADVLMNNLIEDAIERDDKESVLMAQRREKLERGKHLRKLAETINSCGVKFNVWEKKNADGKGSGTVDWTSLKGDEKRKLLKLLPDKLVEQTDGIH